MVGGIAVERGVINITAPNPEEPVISPQEVMPRTAVASIGSKYLVIGVPQPMQGLWPRSQNDVRRTTSLMRGGIHADW